MEWYLEYDILHDRPGIFGGIATFLGLMGVNIITINGLSGGKRGLLLACSDSTRMDIIKEALEKVDSIKVTAFKKPSPLEKIGLKQGRIIDGGVKSLGTYGFVREDLGTLVVFLGELLAGPKAIIGLRGMPRVGKTEAAIAACVYANKKWVVISSTLMRQFMRTSLSAEELADDCVYLIDGIVSCVRGSHEHKLLVAKILEHPAPKIIEHPDVFLRENALEEKFFDCIIELRRHADEVIDYNLISESFSSFDIS